VNVPANSARNPVAVAPPTSALREHVGRAVRRYLADLGDHLDGELHAFVLREVEAPLFSEVMRHYDGNQTRAAAALGINRATLRRRLRDLGLEPG
jgi:Fis family transcriptional regulator, factor for inversion stimulation protein